MISAFRTLVVSPSDTCGVPIAWPLAGSTETLDYSLDCSALMADAGDTITAVGMSFAPWGAGEVAVLGGSITGSVVTFWLTGGIAGRNYTVWCDIQGTSDNFERLFRLTFNPTLSAFPPPPPVNPTFDLDNFFYVFAA
jgi:hypothetical protein